MTAGEALHAHDSRMAAALPAVVKDIIAGRGCTAPIDLLNDERSGPAHAPGFYLSRRFRPRVQLASALRDEALPGAGRHTEHRAAERKLVIFEGGRGSWEICPGTPPPLDGNCPVDMSPATKWARVVREARYWAPRFWNA